MYWESVSFLSSKQPLHIHEDSLHCTTTIDDLLAVGAVVTVAGKPLMLVVMG